MTSLATPQTTSSSDNLRSVDYKNVIFLRKHTTYFYKIKPRYYSKENLRQQKLISKAIKRARFMALLPYVRS
ncbi:30S ribosomal protein S18 [Candidatus Peregrinibacteria bacterium]|nr:30S ribosomal protein S18 [Candidatus Peregrinibacteria bacterium]